MGELVTANDISEEDYRSIEEAVMETARGRWFLMEYARRNRVSETTKVLDAINSLKSYITREHETADTLQMRLDIVDMTQKIEQIKHEIANADNGASPDLSKASLTLNVVVDETEQATSTILNAAEQIQGLAWEIRDSVGADAQCDKIDEFATEIYMACSFQDLTGQRLRRVVELTEMLEKRLKAMVDLWGDEEIERYRDTTMTRSGDDALKNGPAIPGEGQGQEDIDFVLQAGQGLSIDQATANDLQWDEDSASSDTVEAFIIDDTYDDLNDVDLVAFEDDTIDEGAIDVGTMVTTHEKAATGHDGPAQLSHEEEMILPLAERSAVFN